MRWVAEHAAAIILILMVIAALLDPRPRHDITRRSKRDRKRTWYR